MASEQQKSKKNNSIRCAEYYDLQTALDELYAQSQNNKVFTDLMNHIISEENIMAAYRNIKNNSGSYTKGTDGQTIRNIEKLPPEDVVSKVRNKLRDYKPKPVLRVEIPKNNGKKRALGIPTIWDRLIQQCILQVLEPICEARFYKRSYGFRPLRSAQHAMADCMRMAQCQNLHYVVDMDICGFFDNVNHSKLIKQMWTMGIQDKKLISIIKEMLKAPIYLPDKTIIRPNKGTPQGGILSPLLANIVLNELDWWIATQWEEHPTHYKYKFTKHKDGSVEKGTMYNALRNGNLKEMYIVRYADDFKIFCREYEDAKNVYEAVKLWLEDRLKLQISEDKSGIVNLRKEYSEFLGIKFKVVSKRDTYVVESHICDKARESVIKTLRNQIKKIEHPKDEKERWREITLYNSMVMGIHNYYKMATHINIDMNDIARGINLTLHNRLRRHISKKGDLTNYRYIKDIYGKSEQMRFVNGYPICPIGYVQTKHPINCKRTANKYTEEGRKVIHSDLKFDVIVLHKLMQNAEVNKSIEFADNRISLYAAQKGKCAVTGLLLKYEEIHCHHKIPVEFGGTDEYKNLIIISKDVHRLIHATDEETIQKYIEIISPNEKQMVLINKLRKLAQNTEILVVRNE